MEAKVVVDHPEIKNADCNDEFYFACDSCLEFCNNHYPSTNSVFIKQDQPNGSTLATADVEAKDRNSELLLATDSNDSPSVQQATVESSETPAIAVNECSTPVNGSPITKRKRDGKNEICGDSKSCVKKAKMVIDEDKSKIHVKYDSLPRKSKQKLEELLRQWSDWHTKHCLPTNDSNDILESGEGTYFPALRVGVNNSSAVTFWIDNPLVDGHKRELIAVDSMTAPLYDRGYSLEGDFKKLDAFRCFNCGAYSHSLMECPKPRDNVAVNNARTQHQANNRQKSSNSRTPTRYYQNSPAGKYDGLIPGVIQAETRQLLGLGVLDPPPWLNRMRELGYPPGYLDQEDDDSQPSEITIFADEEKKEENENIDKAFETDRPKPPKKMSVQFPGINAVIPKNADERKWAMPPPRLDLPRNVPFPRPNYLSQPSGVSPHNIQRWHADELGPSGCDPGLGATPFGFSPTFANQRLGGYQSPRNLSPLPMLGSPIFRSGPPTYGGSPQPGSHLSPYPPRPSGLFAPENYNIFGYERPGRP